MIDPSDFRRVMGHFATGVAVVTARPRGEAPCGLTVNAVCSVSLIPTLILVSVDRTADSHDRIRAADAFAVNILEGERGERLSRRFAAWECADKFQGVAFHAERTGAPVLDDALAWVDCTLSHIIPAGDHTLFLGEVAAADAHEGNPLVFYRGGYGRFVP
ncbi:MAG: flavin reductase family protein [Gemmatimonadota bacterium]|jgi:flavin reductase (DIM6/NTAB) family NADH-FMN oxidoreductase RutF|nr:flavin reductase family protein [Gemmatimonadota bacterium]